ncbi:MAG: cyclopropane-fatty-acyl-phospholipid synthase family protein [Bacteroidia bacterium]
MITTIALKKERSFYRTMILEVLGKMPYGRLELSLPDGETIYIGNGEKNIHAQVNIRDNRFFKQCFLFGDIGFGESYVNGYWETDNITNVIRWFLVNVEHAPSMSGSNYKSILLNLFKFANKFSHFSKANTINGSKENIHEHYDLSNDFFKLFLDKTMTYSSAYFTSKNQSLEEAQFEKYDRLCQQLKITENDHVLEIGSGWGGNAIHIAKNYNCKVTTATISEEQFQYTTEAIKRENLSDKVTVLLKDYRLIEGKFDKIVSIEMLEAVGHKFLDVYFKKCNDLLKKDGILALQVITCPDARYEQLKKGIDWIQKYIFPGSLLPSVAVINNAVNASSDMSLIDLKDIGLHYAETLNQWSERFHHQLEEVKKLGFNDAFIRKWNYYLSYCEAAFEMRNISVMQLVYARPNNRIY